MIKKSFIILAVFATLGVTTLFISNLRYSFYPIPGSGWSIGFKNIKNPLEEFEPSTIQILSPDWLNSRTPQNTRFLADPFVIMENQEYYIFFEHQAEGNANIGLLKSQNGQEFEYLGEVLDEDFHLSFPQVFKYNGAFYMLPETKQAGHVLLYKAENFPNNWKLYDTLIKNVALQDPAILISDSLYLISGRSENLTQYVYTSASLNGKWKKDKRFTLRKGDETRAAGNFFNIEGRWYIPFQKNNNGYGSGVSLYELNITGRNIKFKRIIKSYLTKSDKIKLFNKGMHHFSITKLDKDYFSVFDGDMKDHSKPRTPNWKASLKYNFYDFMDLLNGKNSE
ncbi:hypothetical protein JM83_0488 [Gillisia sp. Hel_I_86]|uniref:glucosamine inositolphosphorylceramide transferase family protein n=1 Tax=Gillisia sp. Hel_I_86 TaxID=1249981 RepID=UPI00119B2A4B|nr:hypothetical protein [Gillisia sp. Hel_I_86]TVZ25563.1 hypothetical protein JM83_0488 [Gillisia sp. Hel_I_86]